MKGYKHLSFAERLTIQKCLKMNYSKRAIARLLERGFPTVSREIARGQCQQMDTFGRVSLKYDPYYGQLIHNIESSKKGRSVKIGSDHKTARRLEELIKTYRYSPYAALIRMSREGSLHTSLSVGTVYRYIHQGVLDITEEQLPHGRSRKRRKEKRAFSRPSEQDQPSWRKEHRSAHSFRPQPPRIRTLGRRPGRKCTTWSYSDLHTC